MENENAASGNFIDLDVRLAWYLQTWFIVLCAMLFFLVVPLVGAIVLVVVQHKKINKALREYESRINEMIPPDYRTATALRDTINKRRHYRNWRSLSAIEKQRMTVGNRK